MGGTISQTFALQAQFCRATGSPLTADVLEALIAVMDRTTRTGARILDWPGDPMVDALKLRIAGGLNALARSGVDPQLVALYAAREGDWQGVIARVLREHDDWLLPWLDGPPQTNEVARAGVLWPGLMEVARRFGPRLELLELGASAGLNLNMDRFAYRLAETVSGDRTSAVRIEPAWTGPPPALAKVEVVDRAGVDLHPLDISDDQVAARLLAYIWPDQDERVARIEAAIDIARRYPPPLEKADGADWLEARLYQRQVAGVTRVVYHSVALQYFPPDGRARVRAAIEAAGKSATLERPVAWLSMEFPEVSTVAELRLQCWPGGGESKLLALCHPHGAHVEWKG